MEKTGRKNAAGGWVRGEFLQRIAAAGMLFMAVMGFGLGSPDSGLAGIRGLDGKPRVWRCWA